ncbi:interferon-related developmental regulator 2 [Selaginella moellendorffii]|nr:interferon-related developmental regulator 2 [Selaginella moellendorffii]|eukprot:XP_002987214.2 interferon-related developmental regulator 2 [Selaginella moellendorffii]
MECVKVRSSKRVSKKCKRHAEEKENKLKQHHECDTKHMDDDSSSTLLDLEASLDCLYEKRSSTREAGLKGMIDALRGRVMTHFIDDKYETLTHQILSSIKQSSSTEAVLAGRALAMVSITAGAGKVAEHVFEASFPHLSRSSKLGRDSAVRVSAIEALGMLTFVGGVEASTESAMEVLWQIVIHKGSAHADQTLGTSKPPPPVKAAAITAWSLLLSTLSSKRVMALQLSSVVGALSSLLEDPDLGVRKAAGEAIALLCELGDIHLLPQALGEGETTKTMAMELQVVDQMKALAASSSRKGQTKKERSEQRSSFRDMVAILEGGACHETCLKLKHGDSLKISTWSQTVQLNAFRRLLGEGFQRHLQENNLLHEVFNFVPSDAVVYKGTTKQQKHHNCIVSKMKTQLMNQRRCALEASRNFSYDSFEIF